MISPGRPLESTPRKPNRRRFVAACVGSAAVGASWMTGLALLARGRHPQMFVVGADSWQVVLVEHGDHRIAILSGEFERSPEPEIDRLCSVLRQRIDVVAGTRVALSLLSNDFRDRRSVDTVIQLDGSPGQMSSTDFVPMTQPVTIAAGAIEVHIRPLPTMQRDLIATRVGAWIAHLHVQNLVVAIAPSLDLMAHHASVESTLAIAPEGEMGPLSRTVPDIAVAINARSASRLTDSLLNGETDRRPLRVIRIFPRDIAGFVFRGGLLVLPNWADDVRGEPTSYSSSRGRGNRDRSVG